MSPAQTGGRIDLSVNCPLALSTGALARRRPCLHARLCCFPREGAAIHRVGQQCLLRPRQSRRWTDNYDQITGIRFAQPCRTVVITLISSLTPDDENVCATALLQHFVSVLGHLPIAYAIRIETSDQVLQHSAPISGTPTIVEPAVPASVARSQRVAAPQAGVLPSVALLN